MEQSCPRCGIRMYNVLDFVSNRPKINLATGLLAVSLTRSEAEDIAEEYRRSYPRMKIRVVARQYKCRCHPKLIAKGNV